MISQFKNVRAALTHVPLFAAGCATAPLRVSEPVGPGPEEAATEAPAETGRLFVLTAEAPRSAGEVEFSGSEYAPYSIADQTGHTIRIVDDSSGQPEPISLPPGDYFVRGLLLGTKPVEIPVHIVKARTTTVHLDGNV
jgi:hypothetical protein